MENIKAVIITTTMCSDDLTNLPVGLEMLYLDDVVIYDNKYDEWFLAQDSVDLNLPYTLNCLYVSDGLYKPKYKVPYGCKIELISPHGYMNTEDKECHVLNKMLTQYSKNQILIIPNERQLKQYCQNRIAPKNKMA